MDGNGEVDGDMLKWYAMIKSTLERKYKKSFMYIFPSLGISINIHDRLSFWLWSYTSNEYKDLGI